MFALKIAHADWRIRKYVGGYLNLIGLVGPGLPDLKFSFT